MQNVSKYAQYVKLVSSTLIDTMKYQTHIKQMQSLVAHVQLDHKVLGNVATRIQLLLKQNK